jgi:hypothetical protein
MGAVFDCVGAKDLLEFVWAKCENNGAIGIGPFSCRFQRLVGPNGQLLHPLHGQASEFLEGQKTMASFSVTRIQLYANRFFANS